MSNTNTPPGLMHPTMASYAPGAGNPRESAMMSQQDMNMKQQNLNSSVGGRGKYRRYRGGDTNNVQVPQFQMQYTPTGGPGTNPNDQITGLSSTSMQSTAWAANDNQATQMGGWKKHAGGNNDWNWGCYSGGKRRRKSKKRSKRKLYKSKKIRRQRMKTLHRRKH